MTAEELMRARYTAHVIGDGDFLLRTWHPETVPADASPDPLTQWLGLSVIDTIGGGPLDEVGDVLFQARYRQGGRGLILSERSRFVRLDGHWVYRTGRQEMDLP